MDCLGVSLQEYRAVTAVQVALTRRVSRPEVCSFADDFVAGVVDDDGAEGGKGAAAGQGSGIHPRGRRGGGETYGPLCLNNASFA